ncbi:LysR family transcriptional regulator [Holophaga foetida]|uniref:LysR family transcriptional regulator n=1 Tax=Holophaga foetida TaxID=35839 RepID=UPI0002473F19|nr:LysR family transcriptional regulator [Holophaga foetida]
MIGLLDPRRLATFRMVAIHGRLSEAARRLNLSQPAVTAQIQQLEAGLGCRLFLRSRSGMQLTKEGQRLMETAEAIHRLLGEAEQALAEPGSDLGPLRLGASMTTAAYVMPRALALFQRCHPGATLLMEVGNTGQIQAWLQEGRIDLGAVEGLERAPNLRLEPFLDDELVCVGPGRLPLGFVMPSTLAEFGRARILWREPGSGTRAVVLRALSRLSPPRVPRADDPVLGQTEAIKAAVQAGMGLAFLPLCAIQGELARRELRILALPGLRIRRTFSWVVPHAGLVGSAGQFQRLVQDMLAQDG